MTLKVLTLLAASLLAAAAQAQPLDIQRNGAQPTTVGPRETFTGHVLVTPLFAPTEATRAGAASVAFSPGARSAWHSHPAGQVLVVTSGVGWVQAAGGARQEIRAGDVIRTPPGVKHWHGATSSSAMTHIAIQEQVAGKVVEWMEQVSAAEYEGVR